MRIRSLQTGRIARLGLILILTITLWSPSLVSCRVVKSRQNPGALTRTLRVLFIGNSYTYYNNLPAIFAGISKTSETTVETAMKTAGGATLKTHWENPEVIRTIREGNWDFVVLQEQSTLGFSNRPSNSRIADPAGFHKYARLFDGEIKKSGAQTVFFLTWAVKDAAEEDQLRLNRAYLGIGEELKSKVAKIGIAWQKLTREDPGFELYAEDKSHPGPAGSYLAACVLYVTIFEKNPVGLPFEISGNPVAGNGNPDLSQQTVLVKLAPARAKLIQQAALIGK